MPNFGLPGGIQCHTMMIRIMLAIALAFAALAPAQAELDPKAITFRLPDQLPRGPVTASRNQQAVLLIVGEGPGTSTPAAVR